MNANQRRGNAMNNIIGIESAYREATGKRNEDVKVNGQTLVEIIERTFALQQFVRKAEELVAFEYAAEYEDRLNNIK
jgi:hypothetical protein